MDTPSAASLPARIRRCSHRMQPVTPGEITVTVILSPTLTPSQGGLRVAVSFDDEAPHLVTVVPEKHDAANGNRDWRNGAQQRNAHR